MAQQDTIKRVRVELGAVRSCALMMANSQSADARGRYLKALNEKLASIETLLVEALKARPAAPPDTTS